MSEEEVIKVLKNHAQYTNAKVIDANTRKEYKVSEAIDGLLDLYNKEKEKNKELEEMLKHRIKYTNELEKDLFENASNYVIPKSKVREIFENYSQSSLMENNTFLEFKKELLEERN